MNTINNVKTILNLTDDANPILSVLNNIVEGQFKAICGVDSIPESAEYILTQMLLVQWNRKNSYGIAIESYSDLSNHYENGSEYGMYGADIMNSLKKYKRIKVLY